MSEFSQRTVLVTGGTGSFGSTMVAHLLERDVRQVRVLSRDELKQDDMRRSIGDSRVAFYLGDVRDASSVERATRDVDFVFHAAALKQVPSCEFFPLEAVRTNVLGSSNVIDASHANRVQKVVCLGTDKAVYPVNAMGHSKALMEKTAQAYARNNPESETTVSTVRYGNVLCSRGSVVPLLVEQLRAGRRMTVTDPAMTRFLMSLEEAVDLVDHAFNVSKPGDLFIRKAAASTIDTLAHAVAGLIGKAPEIDVIGTRHGEKLYETLATREELARSVDQGNYFRVPIDSRGLNYSEYFEQGDTVVDSADDYHSHNTTRLSVEQVSEQLLALPAFQRLMQ